MITAEQTRQVVVHGWSGSLTLTIILLGMAMIFIRRFRDLLGPLWIGYPAIAFAYILLVAPANHLHRSGNAGQNRSR